MKFEELFKLSPSLKQAFDYADEIQLEIDQHGEPQDLDLNSALYFMNCLLRAKKELEENGQETLASD